MWLFYLGYCEGGFEQGRIETHQIVMGKPEFELPAGGLTNASAFADVVQRAQVTE